MTIEPTVKWKYSTRPPQKTRIEQHSMHLPPGHRYGYKRREDVFHPKVIQYQVYCLCGWRTDGWWAKRPVAFRMADKNHYGPLTNQPTLFGVK